MEFILIHVVVSGIAVWHFAAVASGQQTGSLRSYFFALALVLFCTLGPIPLLLTIALGIAATSLPANWNFQRRLKINAAIMLLIYGGFSILGFELLHRRHQLRREFPMTSLKQRLSVEDAVITDPQSAFAVAYSKNAVFSASVDSRVDLHERDRDGSVREYELRSLHEGEALAFVRASGFGIGRMGPMPNSTPRSVSMPEFDPLPELPADESESFLPLDGGTIPTVDVNEVVSSQSANEALDPAAIARRTYQATTSKFFVPE
jgi:hypothetical protein